MSDDLKSDGSCRRAEKYESAISFRVCQRLEIVNVTLRDSLFLQENSQVFFFFSPTGIQNETATVKVVIFINRENRIKRTRANLEVFSRFNYLTYLLTNPVTLIQLLASSNHKKERNALVGP